MLSFYRFCQPESDCTRDNHFECNVLIHWPCYFWSTNFLHGVWFYEKGNRSWMGRKIIIHLFHNVLSDLYIYLKMESCCSVYSLQLWLECLSLSIFLSYIYIDSLTHLFLLQFLLFFFCICKIPLSLIFMQWKHLENIIDPFSKLIQGLVDHSHLHVQYLRYEIFRTYSIAVHFFAGAFFYW